MLITGIIQIYDTCHGKQVDGKVALEKIIKTILIARDFSDASDHAALYGIKLSNLLTDLK